MTASRLLTAISGADLALPETGPVLILRAMPDADYSALPADRLHLSNSFRPAYERLQQQGFQLTDAPEGPYAMVLVQITRSKQETLGLIASAFALTARGGIVAVDGVKTDGIESALKRCKAVFDIEGVLSKSHGKLFWMRRPDQLPEQVATWRDGLSLTKNRDGFLTAPGVFSADGIDHGSALLAAHFDARLKGHIADLGAGWGWLSDQALAKGNPTQIDLFEAEKIALDAARANIADDRARFFWADVRSLTAETPYDAVISNPPFHQSRAAEPALGLDFIAKAADILKPNGSLWLVANRQLPYEAGLDRCFSHWQALQETQHFKVVLATKPRSRAARNRLANPVKRR